MNFSYKQISNESFHNTRTNSIENYGICFYQQLCSFPSTNDSHLEFFFHFIRCVIFDVPKIIILSCILSHITAIIFRDIRCIRSGIGFHQSISNMFSRVFIFIILLALFSNIILMNSVDEHLHYRVRQWR